MEQINSSKLRQLLLQKAKTLSDKAIDEEGQVSVDELESLERMDRLVRVVNTTQPEPRPKRWVLPVFLLTTLLMVSILLFARVAETEIELDVALSEVAFTLPSQQVLTDNMELSRLGVAGLQEIRLPRTRSQARQTINASAEGEPNLHILVAPTNESASSLSLATLTLPAGSRVGIQPIEESLLHKLSLKGSSVEVRAEVNGTMQIALPGRMPEQFDFASPSAILMRADSQFVDLTFDFPEATKPDKFSSQLLADELTLFRIDEFVDQKHTLVRKVSTILSGTLYFESLNGKARPLRASEALRFEQSRGEIRTIQLHDNHIALKYFGRVRGMQTGSGENERSLMPSYLEWLSARHGLSLLWGTALYIFGLIVGVLRWWGKIKI